MRSGKSVETGEGDRPAAGEKAKLEAGRKAPRYLTFVDL